MKRNKLLITLIIVCGQAFGQHDSSTVYKNLKVVKYYFINLLSAETIIGGDTTYQANGKEINKTTYDKYLISRQDWQNCCPCIIESYDENDNLLAESVSCGGECIVGWLKGYYPNGKMRFIGSYKENPTEDWSNIWERNYCSIKNGLWIYFDENGDTLYSELWDNGEFVKQDPEQNKAEIWDVELILNNQKIDTQLIDLNQVSNLIINPRYKNSSISSNLTLSFEVSALYHKLIKKEFTINTFKLIDVALMLNEAGIPKEKKTSYTLYVYSDNKLLKRFSLNVSK